MQGIKTRIVENDAKPGSKRCQGRDNTCATRLTYAKSAVQFGRAVRAGLAPEQAKMLMPMCQKCMTHYLSSAVPRSAHDVAPTYR